MYSKPIIINKTKTKTKPKIKPKSKNKIKNKNKMNKLQLDQNKSDTRIINQSRHNQEPTL